MFKFLYKKEIKLFIALYVLGYLIVNWSDVSWIFNYKAVGGMAYDFFNPYSSQDILAAYYQNQSLPTPTIPDISLNKIENKEIEITTVKPIVSEKQNILEIPAINLETEVVFPQTADVNILHSYLDKGVVFYPDSVKPGTAGQSLILGHSAPPGWPKIKHDWVFSHLENLKVGDEITLNLDFVKYNYRVINKKIIAKGQEIENSLTKNSNVLVLVSCYPPGKDFQRIVVYAEIENN